MKLISVATKHHVTHGPRPCALGRGGCTPGPSVFSIRAKSLFKDCNITAGVRVWVQLRDLAIFVNYFNIWAGGRGI